MSQQLRISLENETDIAQAQAVAAFCDDTTVVAEFATGESFIVNADGTLKPMTTSPAQKPKATKPKAATPTKRKSKSRAKANTFHRDVIVGKRQNRLKIRNWRETKTSNMQYISQKEAEAHGWSSKRTGKITQKGRKAKPKRTVTWS